MTGSEAIARLMAAPPANRLLFVCYGAGHVLKIAPVAQAMRERGMACVVMALTIGHRKAEQLGLDPVGYRDFLYLVDGERVLAAGRALLDGNRHPDVDEFESICYLGINYLEWVDTLGPQGAARKYADVGRRGFLPRDFFRRLLASLRPAVVVTTSSPRSEQAAIEAAVAACIPSLTMVDFIPPSDPFMSRGTHADRVTVAARFVRDELLARGVAPERVVVTGSPDFDSLHSHGVAMAARACRTTLGWNGLRVVLWAGYLEPGGPAVDPSDEGAGFGIAVERHLRDWVATHPDAALVVRYHPGQYHEFPDLGPQQRVYLSNPITEPLAPLLHLADTVIVQASTVGFEAATLGRRVLTLGFSPSVKASDFDYASFGLGALVQDWSELDRELEADAGNANQVGLPLVRDATARVVREIEALLPSAQAGL